MVDTAGGAFRRQRLLIVDDDAAIVRNWTHLLSAHVDVASVGCFEMAWQATEPEVWRAEPFDYVFLDLRLPDGNGADILSRLDDAEPRPAVAVISGFLDAHEALTIHGHCVIAVPKPADRQVLLGVIAILEESRSGGSLVGRYAAAYGLSPQETRLLLAATREATDKEAADELGCTHATVRSYWRRIFEKTGRGSAREVITELFQFALAPRPSRANHASIVPAPESSTRVTRPLVSARADPESANKQPKRTRC